MAEKETPLGEVMLTDVRLSFANLDKPAKDKKDKKTGEIIKGKHGANFLLSKTTDMGKANRVKVKKACDEVRAAKWGENKDKWPKIKPEKICLRDGDLENYDGYEGNLYVSCNSERAPKVISNRKDRETKKWHEPSPGDKDYPYSGCQVNALIRVWLQDNEHGIRINAQVEVVQFLRDGDPFGAAPVDPNEKFSDDLVGEEGSMADDDEDEDDDDLV